VVSIKKGASVEQAVKLMAEKHVSGLPVVDVDNRVIGIITENDVLLKDQAPVPHPRMALYGWYVVPDELIAEAYRKARGVLVEDAMTKKVTAFDEESAVSDIARVMVEKGINRVPITKNGKLAGIVSRADIVRAMAESLG
jgi:CBS domain-containing protein